MNSSHKVGTMESIYASVIDALALLDHLPDCIAVVDDDFQVLYTNAPWRAAFPCNPAPFDGARRDATPRGAALRAGITAVLRGHAARFDQRYLVDAGATLRVFDLAATPLSKLPNTALVRLNDVIPGKASDDPGTTPHLLVPRREQIVLDVSHALFACPLDLTAIANCLAEQLCRVLDMTSAYVSMYDPIAVSLTVVAEHVSDHARPEEQVSDLGTVYHVPTDFPDTLPYVGCGQIHVVHHDDVTTSTPKRQHMEQYGARSIVNLPLLVRGHIVAYASLWESRQRRVLSEDEIALCLDITHFAAFLIQNAQLIDQTETARVERRLAEANLYAVEVRYRTLIEQLPAIIYINPPGLTCSTLYISPQIQTILGYDPDECVKNPDLWLQLIHPDDYDFVEDVCHHANATGEPLLCEYRMVASDGRIVWVRDEATLIYTATGEPRCWQGILYDITQQKTDEVARLALERHMFETQKLESLGVLTGGVAHDFNNLLAIMLGNAELAALDPGVDASTHKCIDQIVLAGRRATDLVQQMLAYVGQSRCVIEEVDLNMVLNDIMLLIGAALPKHATMQRSLSAVPPTVQGDVTQLRQVVMNLVANAAEALGDMPGVVEVTTALERVAAQQITTCAGGMLPPGDYVAVRVRDSGAGMDNATKQKIFEPFFTTKFSGRGLGLAAVFGIVRQHAGAITVESAPGQGATFTVLLPYVATPAALAANTQAADQCPRGRLLIIDDEPDIRQLLSRIAQRLQMDVLTAQNGSEGIAIFTEQHATITSVLLDVAMPQMHGGEVFSVLQTINPTVPVVLMSGYSAPEICARFEGLAVAGFLQKPFSVHEVQAMLHPFQPHT